MEASANTSRTLSKNKSQHPGAIQVTGKRKRRTKAQIAEDNAAEEAKKQEKTREANEQIKKIASLEGEMAKTLVLIAPTPRAEMVRFIFSLPVQMSQLTIGTDTHMKKSDDDNMYFQPKPKPKVKVHNGVVAINSQSQAKVPNVGDQRDLTSDKANNGSSKQKSNQFHEFLFFFCYCFLLKLASFRSQP